MQLGEARFGKGPDHDRGLLHSLGRRQALPWIGTEMITTENDPFGRKAAPRRYAFHETAEVSRRHAGIAAVLVDLVAGRLD